MASTDPDLTTPKNVVFIDSNVPDLQDLLDGLQPGEIAFVLDASTDGVDQIANILAANGLTDLASISIVGHGASGAVDLGSSVLNDADLSSHAGALAQIGATLAPGGDLQLYACDVASGATGQQFIADLSRFAGGAGVAASSSDIGLTPTGENWALDVTASANSAAPAQILNPFTATAEANFSGTLSAPTTEMWLAASSGGSQNLILHADDTGTHTASNVGTLFTPVSANNPSAADGLNGIDLLQLDTQNQKYFIATQDTTSDEVLEGSLSSVLANPTATPTYTTLYSNPSAGSQGYAILGLTDDPASQQVFFIEGHSFDKVSYAGGTVTTLDNSATAPFLNGLALDLPHHIAYFINSSSVTTTTTTLNGQPDTSDPNGHIHYNVTSQGSIYETSSLTASSGPNSVTVSKLTDISSTLGQIGGPVGVPGFTVDTTTGVIYFSTQSIGGQHPEPGGIFWIDPTDGTHTVHTLFRQNTAINDLLDKGLFSGLQVDHATGLYYVSLIGPAGEGGAVFVGSLSAPGTPTLFETIPTYNGGTTQPAPEGLGLDNAPTLTITPAASPTFTESASNPASTNNTPIALISSASAGDSDNTELLSATVSIGSFFAGDKLGFTNNNNIVGSYNSSTGVLTLSGLDTFAHYQTALQSVQFTSTSENPTDYGSDATRALTWTVYDGLLNSAAQTETITVVGVNDPPTLTAAASANFTEKAGAKTLSSGASVSDPDSLTFGSATVSIAGGTFAGDGDVLAAATTGTSITASYNSTTETLTLTGSDTLAHYQSVLDAVTFNSTSLNPTDYGSNTTRTVTWQLNDGSGSNNLSTVVTTTLNVTAVNDPPTLTGTSGTAAFTEGQAVTLSPSATVADPDNLGLQGATVKVAGGTFTADGDVLATSTIGTHITASYNSSTETLTLSGTDTLANYQTVLDKITFSSGSNPDDYGSQKTRTVTWVLNDGSGSNNLSTAATTTVSITAINDPPVLTSVAPSATYTENAAQLTLAATATVSDVDSLNLANATVKIVGGTFAGDGDLMAVNGVSNGTIALGSNTVSISYNSATETLTLSGSDTLAHYQTLLEEVSFRSTSDNPDNYGANPTRTLTWLLNDGAGSNNLSAVTTTTVSIVAVNDAPTLTVAASASFTENGASVVLTPAVTVSDPDNTTWAGATVKIAGGTFAGDGDVLAADTTSTAISASYNAATETLTLSGTDTLADYQQVLQSVSFVTASDNPTNYGSNATRTITWVANDGSGSNNLSTVQTETVSITAVNDPPTLSNVAAGASYTELGAAAVLSSGLTVTDPDSLTLANATVSIAGGTFAGDGDVLSFSTAGTSITASYNAASETLTLSGSDTLAHYQSVLDSVAFSSTSHNPTDFGADPTRTVTWLVNDGSGSSNLSAPAATTVTVTAVNDAPTLTGTTSASFTENSPTATTLSPSVTVSDPDNQTLAGATVQITGGTFAGDGDVLASDTTGTSITASYNAATETLTLSGSDTLAHYQQVLDKVTFTTPSDNPTDYGADATRTVTWLLNDGSGSNNLSAAQTSTISITAINDAPTLSGVPANVTFATGATITLASLAAASDPDNLDLASATVSITGGTFAGDGDVLSFSTAGTSITASYDTANEVLTLTGSDTLANYQTVLDSITFASGADPSNGNANPTRTLSWVVSDGTLTSAPQTETITVQNTPAVNPPAHATFTENQASPTTLAPALVATDPNSTTLISAAVALAGTFAGDGDVLAAMATGNITVSYDAATETLTLSGSDTLANYQQVLDSVTFTTPSDNPTNFGADPTRTVTWTVVDDTGSTNSTGTATSTIDITAVNDAPTFSAAATGAQFTENGSPVVLSSSASVSDLDNLDLASATVSITTGTFAGDGDVLTANVSGTNITASYDSTSEVLVLSGSDTLANYQQVLDSVAFNSTSDNPTDFGSSATRQVTWVLNDGSGSSNLSTPATTTVTLTAVNDPPTIAAAASDAFATGQTLTLSPTLSVSDPDNLGLASATVSVTAGSFAGDGDVLAANTTGTSITASYDASTETLTLSGSDTVAHYQQVLDSVTFSSGADPTGGGTAPTRTVTWTANDGSVDSAPATTTVNLQVGPAIFVPANATFTENQASPSTLSPTIALSDSNAGATIVSATVAIAGGTFAGDGDVLAATAPVGITVSYDAANEVLTLSGTDTVANYQSYLESVTFTSTSDNPTDFAADPARAVTWTVVDDSGGAATSSTATSSIGITAVNDPPTLNNVATGAQFTEGGAVVLSNLASVTDPDSLDLASATVSITTGTFAGDGDVLAANVAGTNITASYDSTSEVLVLSGSDTLAHYQQVLDTVAFNSTSDNPTDFGSVTTHQVTWDLNDGSASNNLSFEHTTTVTLTAVNDPPTLASVAPSVGFTVGTTITLSPNVTVTDPDNLTLASATVSIAGGTFAGDGDALAANVGGTSIVASYDSANERLVLSGSDTLADYQSVLDSVTFSSGANPNNGNGNPTRTVTWVVDDGSGSFSLSGTATTTINIAHEPPTLTSVAPTLNFTQANTTTISPSITVSDFDSASLASATVKIAGGSFAGDGDALAVNVGGTSITASYNAASETLTLTGTDTLAHYQSVLDSVKFSSGSDPTDHGSNPTRTVTWTVNDGNASLGQSAAQTTTITITPLDAAPTLSTVATSASFTENGSPVTVSGNLSVSDPDSTAMTSATVSIAGGAFAGDNDVLSFSTTGTSITASYDSTSETLTLTGSDTLAHYRQVLDSVTFATNSDNPTDYGSAPTREITWVVKDDFNVASALATTTVSITAINDPPTLAAVATSVSFLAGSTVQLSPTLSVSDPDSLNLASATVKITGGSFAGDGDVLSADVAGTHITASYDAATETLTLTGPDPIATFQAVLDSISFASGDNPTNFGSNPTRTVTWVLNDGAGSNNLSTTATTTIDISTVNTPPALSNIPGTVAFTEGQNLTLAGSASVSDPDNQNLAGATVSIIDGAFAGDGDVLNFSTTGTAITASYDSATETLTLSGSDTKAHYQQVLDSITFSSGNNPDNYTSDPTRIVTWLADDGSASNNLSTVQTETISITPVNNPPTLSNVPTSSGFTENGSAVLLSPTFTAISLTDPDNLQVTGATVSITGGTFAGDGDVLATDPTGTAITASYDSATETLVLSGTDTLADYRAVLSLVTFSSTSDNPDDYGSAPTRTVTWTVNDGSASSSLSTPQTTTVSITAINDPPTLSGTGNASFTDSGAPVTLSGSASVTDPDSLDLASATVAIISGSFAGDGDVLAANVAGTAITASYNAAAETLTLTGSDTLAHYQQVLESITFASTSHNPTDYGSNPTRTVAWTLNDGSGGLTSSTATISITAVNDPPTVTAAASTSYTENGGPVVLSPSTGVGDVDSPSIVDATVNITGFFAKASDFLAANTTGTNITANYVVVTDTPDPINHPDDIVVVSETLTLTGTDTFAHYQQVLDSVTFDSTSGNPTNYGSNPTRVITWVVDDGGGSNNLSAPASTTVSITPVNDPPFLSNMATFVSYNIGSSYTTLSPNATPNDPDNLNLANATVFIDNGFLSGDELAANVAGTAITASYSAATGTLTLAGSDTLAHYQQVLDSVAYRSTAADSTNGGSDSTRDIRWLLNDGATFSRFESTIVLTEPPALDLDAAAGGTGYATTFTENGSAVAIAAADVTITDNDPLMSGATIVLTNAQAGDVLTVPAFTSLGITSSVDTSVPGQITVRLSGFADASSYQTALQQILFSSPGDNPTGGDRDITVVISDDGGANSNIAHATVHVIPVNDPPTLSNVTSGVAVTATGQTVTLSPGLSVSDPDNLTLANATVAITAGAFAGDGDILAANVAGTAITASYNAATETLTLTGSDTLAHYQSVLDSVTFNSTSLSPSNGGANPTRTVSWVANDGSGSNNLSAVATTTIEVPPSSRNDFNGDRISDLIFENQGLGNNSIMIDLMNGASITSSATVPNFTDLQVEATGDFNGDSKTDILLQASDGTPQIWFMNGTSVTSTVTLPNPGASWHVVATGDFNGDGNTDILWQNTNGAPAVWLGNGSGSFTDLGPLPNPGSSWHAIGAGDFNGDGKTDILWQNDNGAPAVWLSNGTSFSDLGPLPNPGPSWHAIGVGDVNGDGKADILWQNDNGAPAVWLSNGTSFSDLGPLPNPGPSWHLIGPSDFNGDGKSDLLWQNSDGTPMIWLSNGTSFTNIGSLANQGVAWKLKDDGPFATDQTGAQTAVGSTLTGLANNSSPYNNPGVPTITGVSPNNTTPPPSPPWDTAAPHLGAPDCLVWTSNRITGISSDPTKTLAHT